MKGQSARAALFVISSPRLKHLFGERGNAGDCDSLSLLVWPKKQTDLVDKSCKSGDAIACRVVSSSARAMKVNVDKNAQFAMF
jgi:hypothetical protein